MPDPDRVDPTEVVPDEPESTGLDIAELDPQFADVKPRVLRCADELNVGEDSVMRVSGYPYGIAEVVEVKVALDPSKRIVTLAFPTELYGMVDIEIAACNRLEVHSPEESDAKA